MQTTKLNYPSHTPPPPPKKKKKKKKMKNEKRKEVFVKFPF